ncbi:MAG: 1-acyl-sn-glycerol-3-phosphate acyltransferase [Spirochaetaceae bacterium]|jgi:1-acyl-sn-glycerol-3-phosphate acyltransferase|nr:1-acyl-sn-glycerol-3-phosphate acyltransferase [Spirochaetaceae bacterium]
MSFRRAVTNKVLKGILDTICRIDSKAYMETLSQSKPMIVVMNHINFLEVPILVTHSYPLYVTGLVKAETWNNPLMAFLCNTYKAIPIQRKGSYNDAFAQVQKTLEGGSFVVIAPEGTRSKDGVLRKGKAGIVQLALATGASILPIAHYGGERVWENMKRFKRTPFTFKVGRPFHIAFDGRPGRTEREEILSEVMAQIARLLPEEMRGCYASQAEQETKFLEFIDECHG